MTRHLDLFSGVGGFALAARWTGMVDTVGFVELDPWCRRVLAKHWPGVPQHDDVKTLTADIVRQWGERTPLAEAVGNTEGAGLQGHRRCAIDLITGGYPCQPFSVAGQRLGAEDDRHLWPHMRRVIDEVRPRFVLAENVAGHVSMGLDVVLAELGADGYTCGAVVIPACAVNALHRRDRVWIMAHTGGERRQQIPEGAYGDETAHEGWPAQYDHQSPGGDQGFRFNAPDQAMADAERSGGREHVRANSEQGAFLASIGPEGAPRSGSGGPDGPVADTEGDRERAAHVQTDALAGSRAPRAVPSGRGQRSDGTGRIADEAPRSVDASTDGLPGRLVRRPAAGPVDPDLIRAAWADGSWEYDLPRVVVTEPERRQKLMAAGNAIVPIVAYEILSVMLEGN